MLAIIPNHGKGQVSQNKPVRVEVNYPVVPLLKRQVSNELLCIKIFKTSSAQDMVLKTIESVFNKEAIDNIEKIFISNNGNNPHFDKNFRDIVYLPTPGKQSIPVNTTLKQGWNYIWLGASLKPNAAISAKLMVTINSLTDQQSLRYNVDNTSGSSVKRMGVAVRNAGEDNVHTYRIPGLVSTSKGTLIAVYDNRYKSSKDLPGNIDIAMSRSTDGGLTWESSKVIMDMGEPHENNGVGDPAVLFDPATGKIWVAGIWSKGNRSIAGSEPGLSPDSSGQYMLVSSSDDGLTWSEPYNITAQIKNPKWHIYFNAPGKGMVMQDGTLVFPSQYWDESSKPGIPHSSIIYSKDNGKTWISGTGARYNTNESQVVETTKGTLMLNMRDNRGFYRAVSTTDDMGKTWKEHHSSHHALNDPICMASIIKAKVNVKGALKEVLFFSNVNMSAMEHSRKNMTIKASLDLGETWLNTNELLLDERYGYGYSCLTKIDDNTLGILFEGDGELIFMRVPVSDIIK